MQNLIITPKRGRGRPSKDKSIEQTVPVEIDFSQIEDNVVYI